MSAGRDRRATTRSLQHLRMKDPPSILHCLGEAPSDENDAVRALRKSPGRTYPKPLSPGDFHEGDWEARCSDLTVALDREPGCSVPA
jgi:hypothetical protein